MNTQEELFEFVRKITEESDPISDDIDNSIRDRNVDQIPQAKKELSKYLEVYNEFDRNLNKLIDVFDSAFDSPLIESVWRIGAIVLENFSEKFDIDIEAIEWFIHDNAQGKNKFEADGIPIESIDDFILVELGLQYTLKNNKVVYLGEFDLKEDILSYSILPDVTGKEEKEIDKLLIDALKSFVDSVEGVEKN